MGNKGLEELWVEWKRRKGGVLLFEDHSIDEVVLKNVDVFVTERVVDGLHVHEVLGRIVNRSQGVMAVVLFDLNSDFRVINRHLGIYAAVVRGDFFLPEEVLRRIILHESDGSSLFGTDRTV